jgi:hypothetical protein
MLVSATTGHAGLLEFYSVDQNTQELVRIHATTGHVTVVSSLGFTAGDVDLTAHQGGLYGSNSSGGAVHLLKINPLTGAVLSDVTVTSGGAGVAHAEGLASLGNDLVLGYVSGASSGVSNSLGTVNLSDGTLSNRLDYASVNPSYVADFDGLTADATGGAELLSVDSHTPASADNSSLFQVNRSPQQYNDVDVPFLLNRGINDLAFLGTDLYGLYGVDELYKIDPANGDVLQTITLDRSGLYYGLADASAVPEPSSFAALGGLLAVGLIARLSRRRKRNAG